MIGNINQKTCSTASTEQISVVIPTCNRKEKLIRAINSIAKQTIVPKNVIVVFDGKERISLDSLNDYPFNIKIFHTGGGKGPNFARNLGMAVANSKYVAFLDDDDRWATEHIEQISKRVETGHIDMISAERINVLEGMRISEGKVPPERLEPNEFLIRNPGITGSNIVVKKNYYENRRMGRKP